MSKTDKLDKTGAAKLTVPEAEWREKLTPEQFQVTRQHGTERAFSHPYYNDKRDGMYRCVCCGAPLFSSDTKFNSGTGWPSFSAAAAEGTVTTHEDSSTVCAGSRCDAPVAMHISATSFPTGQVPLACGTASMDAR